MKSGDELELNAYLDGELSDNEQAELLEKMRTDAEFARRRGAWAPARPRYTTGALEKKAPRPAGGTGPGRGAGRDRGRTMPPVNTRSSTSSRLQTTTCAPASASARAIDLPSPLLPPVTTGCSPCAATGRTPPGSPWRAGSSGATVRPRSWARW